MLVSLGCGPSGIGSGEVAPETIKILFLIE
jgi:hypothetical protein